jgi:hypothetical protein
MLSPSRQSPVVSRQSMSHQGLWLVTDDCRLMTM